METIKGLIKSLINGGIGAIVGAAFATAFGWNEWILAVIGYILGWLLLSKSFWEGVRESKEELAEEDRRRRTKKKGGKVMTKKGVAEWVSIILCLLPSPFVIMFLLIVAGEIREAWHITNFLAVTLCAIVGLIALLFTSWVLGKLVYFIIK